MNHSTSRAIAILEDNAERWQAMQACLADRYSDCEVVWRRSAPEMIAWFLENFDRTIAVSLDHDLEPLEGGPDDPGTGRDVSNWLCKQPPSGPILIHSTNVPAAQAMESDLAETGWRVDHITPYEDLLWVREAWLPMFCRMIRDGGKLHDAY